MCARASSDYDSGALNVGSGCYGEWVTSQTSKPSFGDLFEDSARLIRCTEPPAISKLTAGDMVICEDDWDSADFMTEAAAAGVHVQVGKYRYENERVISRRARRAVSSDYPTPLALNMGAPPEMFDPSTVTASTDGFARTWDTLAADVETAAYEPANAYMPQEWADLLPYPTINPAQVQAAPAIFSEDSVMVVAGTGAGKTVLGMMAVLQEIKKRGGKAAWLVPQRSLTNELDQGMKPWRDAGIKVVALSGEASTDLAATRDADLWVATVEKFEALCRSSSMRETISQIDTLVVDEIHLLGDPSRGPLLEALLARIRGEASTVRVVGLSATVANAQEVADWLDARLVEITWRPTRLTQQVLTLPIGDRNEDDRHRNALTTMIVSEVSADKGSTLVFCGTKRNVRSTALAIAALRGANTRGVDKDDIDHVAEICSSVGVGLHYSDWPHRAQSERLFRDREIDVLVATSTLAAGVNTPARVVVVRDTSIGPTQMEVSMVQQMFGRAGRAGQEPEGWAFLLTASNETSLWRRRLSAGYTILSGIGNSVEDHILGEIVQGNITTQREIDTWWEGTLARHQGALETAQITTAVEELISWKFIDAQTTPDGDRTVKATRLGALTSRMMVSVRDARALITAFRNTPTPNGAATAENAVIETLASAVSAFVAAPAAAQDQALALLRIISMGGDISAIHGLPNRLGDTPRLTGSHSVHAGLLISVRSPRALLGGARQIAGVNRALFNPAIYDTPRYFAWLSALGTFGTIPPWVSVVAGDLGHRVSHYRLTPPRGAGRLLRAVLGKQSTRGPSAAWKAVQDAQCRRPEELTRAGLPKPKGLATVYRTDEGTKIETGAQAYTLSGGRWDRMKAGDKGGALLASFGRDGDWSGTGWLDAFSTITTW